MELLDCFFIFCSLRMCTYKIKLSASCRETESKNEFCLDLRKQDAANVSSLLRLHLKHLANIPCNIGSWLFEFISSSVGNYLISLMFRVCSFWLSESYHWCWWRQFQDGTKKKKGVNLLANYYFWFLHYTCCLAGCMILKSIRGLHLEFSSEILILT